ncbi:MAG: DUF1292 domain-containing protein [Candidatus Gastranaerophilaceae bacterium]
MSEEMNEESKIISTVDEDGNEVQFEIVDIIAIDDTEYGLLYPITDSDDEEEALVVMRLEQDGDDYVFERIEDDDEFEKVSAFITGMAQEEDDGEE